MFQPAIKYFKPITNDIARTWKSIGLTDEKIKPLATSDNSLNPRLDYFNNPKFLMYVAQKLIEQVLIRRK